MAELRYVPGERNKLLLAAGGSFVVLLDPLDDDHVERIWKTLEAGRSLAHVLDAVTRGQFENLPTFILVVRDLPGTGLRLIQRPGIVVSTTATDGGQGRLTAGEATLWSEHSLGAGATLQIDAVPGAAAGRTLRLVSGVVRVSSVSLTPSVEAVEGLEDRLGVSLGDVDPVREAVVRAVRVAAPSGRGSRADQSVVAPVDLPVDGLTMSEPFTITGALLHAQVPEPPHRADGGDDAYDSLFGATTFRSVESAAVRPEATGEVDADVPAEPVAPLASEHGVAAPRSQPVAEPNLRSDGMPMIDSVPAPGAPAVSLPSAAPEPPGDHDGYTVSAASLRSLRGGSDASSPGEPQVRASASPMVHAITCASGHPNPPQSGTCRVCGKPMPFQDPVTVPRPPLGVLVFGDGREVVLDRFVLVGRSPAVDRVAPQTLPHLVKLDSPSKDLSRSHVEIRLEGWHVLVVDLQSTNGTVVQLPGRQPERLHPLEPFAIVPGTVVTLGDEQSFAYEVRG